MDDLPYLFQPAMRVMMRVIVFVQMLVGRFPLVGVLMNGTMIVFMLMTTFIVVPRCVDVFALRGLLPELLARQLFFAGGNNIDLDSADAAAVHARDFQTRIHAQSFHSLRQELGRYSGIDQRAKKHVAADPGKTF
jgi:hypothetical protein